MKKITRRQLVLGLGAAGTGAALSATGKSLKGSDIKPGPNPSCVVSAEQTEGPFYFETRFVRKDLTEGKEGLILDLRLKMVDADSCEPISDAVVDIWSCDAAGEYSGYETVYDRSGTFDTQRGDRRDNEKHADDNRPRFHQEPNNEKTFLRGAQVTNEEGEVSFKTIYPGWYPGRATHIHIKVYIDDKDVFTSQMYFPEDVNEIVHTAEAYNTIKKKGERRRNEDDGIFRRGGNGPMVELTKVDEGYIGTLTYGISRS